MSDLLESAGQWVTACLGDEHDGQAMVEYALLFVLIVIACLAVMTALGDVVVNGLWGVISSMPLGV
jgi:Flp pilus assembly pilin Flp